MEGREVHEKSLTLRTIPANPPKIKSSLWSWKYALERYELLIRYKSVSKKIEESLKLSPEMGVI
jgi:hypothetical protein